MDSEYDKQYKADDRFQQVFGALTGFAILISCLGLFGLATFTVAKRTKEIGIRKVIGASTTNLMVLLSTDFIKTVLISILIGIPNYLLYRQKLAGQLRGPHRTKLVAFCSPPPCWCCYWY